MDKKTFESTLKEFIESSSGNFVGKDIPFRDELIGMRIFAEPVFGYASAADPFFDELKNPGIIGPGYMAPIEWLTEAKTVISLFLPFTEQVRRANGLNMSWPSDEWLLARIQGQAFQNDICRFGVELFTKEGFSALSPAMDPRFKRLTSTDDYAVNWSERHTAYAAGLGTFGLSKGLITRKGMAGRFLSFISSINLEPDERPYKGIYDYCSFCGACARNCPAGAISIDEKTKYHQPCSSFLDSTREKHAPYYGCGKCQVKVPCESKAARLV
ncbi:MAG: 4Fe-4S binding protein [Treponema sp.]|nr:4Fe-4S binding protein [Treponema sp.]